MPARPLLLPCPPRSAELGRGLPPHRAPRQPSFSRGWRQGEGGGDPPYLPPLLLPAPCLPPRGASSLLSSPRPASPSHSLPAALPSGRRQETQPALPRPGDVLRRGPLSASLFSSSSSSSSSSFTTSSSSFSPRPQPPRSGPEPAAVEPGGKRRGRRTGAGQGWVGLGWVGSGRERASGAFPSPLHRSSLSVVPGAGLLWLGSHRCAWVRGVRACI